MHVMFVRQCPVLQGKTSDTPNETMKVELFTESAHSLSTIELGCILRNKPLNLVVHTRCRRAATSGSYMRHFAIILGYVYGFMKTVIIRLYLRSMDIIH